MSGAADGALNHLPEPQRRVAAHVWHQPGVHFNALGRELDLSPEPLEERLAALRDGGTLVADELFGQTHYYPPTYDEWERAAIALLRRETTRDVVLYLLEAAGDSQDTADPAPASDSNTAADPFPSSDSNSVADPFPSSDSNSVADPASSPIPPAASVSPADIADAVGIARSTLQWHLDRLLEAGVVTKERDGRRVYVSLARPAETEALLPVVRPTLPVKWLDRTMRLVDHLLER